MQVADTGVVPGSGVGNRRSGINRQTMGGIPVFSINEILNPYTGDLIVTPKEIDTLIEDISLILAGSLDAAFHPQIAAAEEKKQLIQ